MEQNENAIMSVAPQLRDDASSIFGAAVAAVAPDELVARAVTRDGNTLTLRSTRERFELGRNVRV